MSLARYLVRMRGRATPFGTFAGVAPLRFGLGASVRWAGGEVRAGADAVWLGGMIARFEADPVLRRRLPVVVNDLVMVRGGRLVVPWQPSGGGPGRSTSAQVSVRLNPVVRAVLQAARTAVRSGDLVDALAAGFPEAPVGALEALVAELVARGVLISSLRPPSTATDGLAHLLDRLGEVEAGALDGVAALFRELSAIHVQLTAADGTGGWAGRAVADRMRALSPVSQPLMVDLRLGCAVVLPEEVAAEAESAAGALVRLAPRGAGQPAWRDYHAAFLDRYGPGAVVAVSQLVDATAGLGFPAHFDEPRSPPSWQTSRRDVSLLALAQQAAMDGRREVVLTEDFLDRFDGGGTGGARPPGHAELWAQVRAPRVTALEDGAFELAVLGFSRSAVAMTGRFLDLLPGEDRRRMAGLYGRLPTGVDGALAVQLSFPPKYPAMENIARAPRLLDDVVGLAEHDAGGGEGRIPVHDLAVTADDDRLYVVSTSRRRVVEPMVAHAAALSTWPPLARFLWEIPRIDAAALSSFAWGTASCLPFLPRVRYGRSVLAPARWRVSTEMLPGPDAPARAWAAAWDAERARLRLPAHVSVGSADRQLLLNMDEPMDAAVLRAHLDRAGKAGEAVTVSEAPAPAERGWFGERAHEVLIPLGAVVRPAPGPAVVTVPGPLPLIGPEQAVLPGAQILFAKLYAQPDGIEAILADHLPALLARWATPPVWWFSRGPDPRPHLRLHLRLPGERDYGRAVAHVGAWAAGLRRQGLIGDLGVDTFHPETARYGTGAVLAAAEALFAADSAAVLAQLAASRRDHPRALTAASMADLAAAMRGGRSAGMRWLIDHPPAGNAPARDRDGVRRAVALAGLDGEGTDGEGTAVRALPGGPRIIDAWRAREGAAAAYTGRLASGPTHVQPTAALESLLHMHHVRAHGIDPASERQCRHLARAIALAWSARNRVPGERDR